MKIVFFGTSAFGAIILEKLVQANLSPVLVVTTPDKPAGRRQELTPPPVKTLAIQYNLAVFQPPNLTNNAYVQTIRQTDAALFVVASYGKILPQALLDIPRKGSLNVHPSLLPQYRGSSPVQAALLHGDKETGVSIIVLDEKMDHGPIVASSNFKIQNPKIAYPELHNTLADLGGDLLIRTIPSWVEGKIQARAQDESQATYTYVLKKEDGRIDWTKPAEYIERQVRALSPWPGTFTYFKSKILKILKAEVIEKIQGKPGETFLAQGDKLGVYTGRDALLVEELQLAGGKPMSAREFLLGHKDFLGIVLSGLSQA